MLDIINGLTEVAWVGIGGVFGVFLAAIGAAVKGTRKSPIEVGHPLPPPNMAEFGLEETRALRRRYDEDRKADREWREDVDRSLAAIHQDTQVLRDRGR